MVYCLSEDSTNDTNCTLAFFLFQFQDTETGQIKWLTLFELTFYVLRSASDKLSDIIMGHWRWHQLQLRLIVFAGTFSMWSILFTVYSPYIRLFVELNYANMVSLLRKKFLLVITILRKTLTTSRQVSLQRFYCRHVARTRRNMAAKSSIRDSSWKRLAVLSSAYML